MDHREAASAHSGVTRSIGPVCAIHQPNFLPRLSTLAKLYAADYWVVLNDVQFVRQDYQHRCRIADLTDPDQQHWLTLPVHLPQGRATPIKDVTIADPAETRRRVEQTLQHAYGRSPYWHDVRDVLSPVFELITSSGQLADVAEASTQTLLGLLGWSGKIVHSDAYEIRNERSARLVDLTLATGSNTYICGTGGARYLHEQLFTDKGLSVTYFRPPTADAGAVWGNARSLSALHAFMKVGVSELYGALNRLVEGQISYSKHE